VRVHCHYQQLLQALAAAFTQCTLPQRITAAHTTASSNTTDTATTTVTSATSCDDDTNTDVETQSSSSSSSKCSNVKYSSTDTQYGSDIPSVQVKPETARVSVI
jgi:hypothetical protein